MDIVISTFSSQALLLGLVILLKWLITRVTPLDSFQFFRLYCQQLALKVNKAQNTNTQRVIAGWLALLISFTTIIIIVWLFEDFIEVLWLWQALLLFLAIDGFHLGRTGKKFAKTLVANDTYQAKQIIKPFLLRDCKQLSIMGLSKAFIEMQMLKTLQLLIMPCCLFLLSGPLAAFSYRLLLEMHYSWNTKCSHLIEFGKPIAFIINVLQWLPSKICSLLLLLLSFNSQTLLFWRLMKSDFFKLNNNMLLHCFALVNGVQLAGVAIYGNEKQLGEKLRRAAFNTKARQPQPSDIIHADNRILMLLIFISIVIIGCAILSFLLSQ